MREFNYLLRVNSNIKERVYAFLTFFDVFITVLIPLQQVLDFPPINTITDERVVFNLFLNGFAQIESFAYITDVINGILLCFMTLFLISFIKAKPMNEEVLTLRQMRNRYIGALAVVLLLVGRFLSYFFICLQIVAIRCYVEKDLCARSTDAVRLSTNIIGLMLSLITIAIQYKYQKQPLPVPNQPWAKGNSNYYIVNRTMLFLSVLILVTEDILAETMDLFLLSLPLLVLSSILLWMILFNITFYSTTLDYARVVVHVIVWNICVYGCGTALIIKQSDFSMTILLGITTFLMILAALIKKHQLRYEVRDLKDVKNEDQAQQVLYQIYWLITRNKNELANVKIEQLYRLHIINCQKTECLCQQELLTKGNNNDTDSQESQEKLSISSVSFLNQSETTSFQQKLDKRSFVLFQLYFDALNKQFDSKYIKFLELYVKITKYNRVYSSLYSLLEQKSKYNNQDLLTYYYLKSLILDKVNDGSSKSIKETFDVDEAITLDKKLNQYKKLVYDTTILIDQFWNQVSKPDLQIRQLIKVGNKIVDSYLNTKGAFEYIIKIKNDHEEAVVIHIKFLEQVMNFEVEGMMYQNLLTNIRQKLQITRQSHYLQPKDQFGIILVSANPQTLNRVLLVNQKFCQVVGYSPTELQGRSLHNLMPSLVAQVHEKMLTNYLTAHRQQGPLLPKTKQVWVLKKDHSIYPCTLEIQARISRQQDLLFLGMIKPQGEITTTNFTFKQQDTFTILTDDQGVIHNATANTVKRFFDQDFFSFEDTRVLITDIINGMSQFTEIQLQEGVQTTIIDGSLKKALLKSGQQESLVPINLCMRSYQLPNKITICEYIFISLCDSDLELKKSLFKKHGKISKDPHQDSVDLQHIDIGVFNSSSGSGSGSVSRSSAMSETMRHKQQLDEKEVPRSLQNLKKAIILFFITLIATSFSVLAVNQVQNVQFKKDSEIVEKAIHISANLNYLRLAFRMMISQVKVHNDEMIEQLDILQERMSNYFNLLQDDTNIVVNEQNYQDQELKDMMLGSNVELVELQHDSSIITYKFTMSLALQQYMAKMQKFITLDYDRFIEEFEDFRLRELPRQPTQYQRDAHYLIINGMHDMRSYTLLMSDLYIAQSKNKSDGYSFVVLLITVLCIVVTFISGLILIPITFALDNQSKSIIEQWMLISQNDAKKAIFNIEKFIEEWNGQIEKEKNQTNQKADQLSANSRVKSGMISEMDQQMSYPSVALTPKRDNYNPSLNLNMLNDDSKLDNSLHQLIVRRQTNHLNLSTSQLFNQYENDQMQSREIQAQSIVVKSKTVLQDSREQKYESTHQQYITDGTPQKHTEQFGERKDHVHFNTTNIQMLESEEEENQLMNYGRYSHELIKIYRYKKLQKVFLIMGFSIIVFLFYISFYLISNRIFDASKESFEYLKTFNRRPGCVANAFNFMIETYAQNQTIRIGFNKQKAFDYVQDECMQFEADLRKHIYEMPPQIAPVLKFMSEFNSYKMCGFVFANDKDRLNDCLTFNNGQMRSGLRNIMQQCYYFIVGEYIAFDALEDQPWKRTEEFLDSHEFAKDTQDQIKQIFRFILPASEYLQDLVIKSMSDYLESLVEIFSIVFSIFMVFMVVSLIVSIKVMMNYLRRVVIRSKLLIKIIPSDTLLKITKKVKKIKKKMRLQ